MVCILLKKCAVCEQTEGETLEHQLTDATYLKGSTCEICKDVIGEPLQPTASEEDIAALQVKLDALVETYNSSNKDAIDIFVEYGEDPDILPQKLNEIYGLSQDFPYWAISFPMIFYKNVNEEPEVPYNFADYTREDSKGSGINDYLHMVQANNDDTKIGGIILWRTMRFVKEIATGNPEVMDIIYGATFQQEECMNVTIKGYGVVKVGDEIYIAKLTEENDIINIYPESHDSIFCPSPDFISSGSMDDKIVSVVADGDVEYWYEEDGTLRFTFKNVGDSIIVKYRGYLGAVRWWYREGEEATNSLSSSGTEVYNLYYAE